MLAYYLLIKCREIDGIRRYGFWVFIVTQLSITVWLSYYLGSESRKAAFLSGGAMGLEKDTVLGVGLAYFFVCSVLFWSSRAHVVVGNILLANSVILLVHIVWLFFY